MIAPTYFHDGIATLYGGDCLEVLKQIADNSIDAVCTDPPYHLTSIVKRFGAVAQVDDTKTSDRARRGADGMARLSRGFMGKTWDGGDIAFRVELWAECWRVLKPGGHIAAFAAPKNRDQMSTAIRAAGFEVRDEIAEIFSLSDAEARFIESLSPSQAELLARLIDHRTDFGILGFVFGSGFPKSHDISKVASDWQGWGTALKPAIEPICLARKPLSEKTVAANVLRWGVGAINEDACRVPVADDQYARNCSGDRGHDQNRTRDMDFAMTAGRSNAGGRHPANVVHDGSPEVVGAFPAEAGAFAPVRGTEPSNAITNVYGERVRVATTHHGDTGSAARFFYSAKADRNDRIGSKHPTVKPVDLMRWLVRLITPPGGTVLDPFAGTGTTGHAALLEGFKAIMIEREAEYQADIARRMGLVFAGETERAHAIVKARGEEEAHDTLPLFGGA